MTHFKLLAELERDIRNQVTINNMLRLNRKQKLMVQLRKHPLEYAAATAALILIASVTFVHAEEPNAIVNGNTVQLLPKPQCPTPGEKCKILILSPQEENLLTGQNGILDTAAQGRQIDLGGFAVYFKSKIATAPAGEVKPVEKPAQGPAVDLSTPGVKPN